MYELRFGSAVRTVRIRRGWRQSDLAARVGISASVVSRIERGDVGRMPLDTVQLVAAALEIRLQLVARWRGGDLDRLLSAGHSALQEVVVRVLTREGWTVLPEVSFSVSGERGVIDLLAWHPATRSLLVVEVKTDIVDVPEMLGTMDRKRRLALEIARRHGWDPGTVSVWLVVADASRNRRRISAHGALLRAALPMTTREMARWIRRPSGPAAGLSFLADSRPGNAIRGFATRKRVRRTIRGSGPAQDPLKTPSGRG